MVFDFVDLPDKLERAVQNLLLLSGVGTVEDTYISSYTGPRRIPNRSIYVSSSSPVRKDRPESMLTLKIMHNFSSTVQQTENPAQRVLDRRAALKATLSALIQGDGQSLQATADQITLAGRDLAIANPALVGAEAVADAALALQNADMLSFRCDEMELGDPMQDRGHAPDDATIWIEDLNFIFRVSNSCGASN